MSWQGGYPDLSHEICLSFLFFRFRRCDFEVGKITA